MLIFYFQLDASTPRGDDYALYRKVNAGTAELVARNLLAPVGRPFFRYMKEGPIRMDSIAGQPPPPGAHDQNPQVQGGYGARRPWWTRSAVCAVSLRATNGQTGANERIVELTRMIPLVNSENAVLTACAAPLCSARPSPPRSAKRPRASRP